MYFKTKTNNFHVIQISGMELILSDEAYSRINASCTLL